MTDRDKSPKGFLERWSRKKIEASAKRPTPAEPRATDVSLPDEPACPSARGGRRQGAGRSRAETRVRSRQPAVARIRSRRSTDIRAFLAPGVPKELARAALRRAWSADPAIRDFKGLAENDWDFTDPTAMPGFGALPEGTDIKKMVAQIFGEGEKPAEPTPPQASRPSPQATRYCRMKSHRRISGQTPHCRRRADDIRSAEHVSRASSRVAKAILCSAIIILHRTIVFPVMRQKSPRTAATHGGALPQ